MHIASVHKKKKFFINDNCDDCFIYKHILKRRSASVHERKKPFICDTCDTRSASTYDLKGHISSVLEGIKVCIQMCQL